MLCILSYSQHFRENCNELNLEEWSSFRIQLEANYLSLEYFAKVRGLQWLNLLTRDAALATWVNQNPDCVGETLYLDWDHPHSWVVPRPGNHLSRSFNWRDQSPISRNVYAASTFERYPKPSSWPSSWSYPMDPTTRRPRTKCRLCHSNYGVRCECDPTTHSLVVRPLVELQHYGGKGIGVRALQYIKTNDILQEHVGELIPKTAPQDNEFGVDLDIEPQNGAKRIVAQISCRVAGNWTRFVNHSCNASTVFELTTIGDKLRVMVVATRDIGMFEEITLDYGDAYFNDGLVCLCGERTCRYRGSTGGDNVVHN